MSENQLWERYAKYRMNQHYARTVSIPAEKYWQGRADSLLVTIKDLGFKTNLQPQE